jgi:hypothetical protein
VIWAIQSSWITGIVVLSFDDMFRTATSLLEIRIKLPHYSAADQPFLGMLETKEYSPGVKTSALSMPSPVLGLVRFGMKGEGMERNRWD